jgi:hypothetical protein
MRTVVLIANGGWLTQLGWEQTMITGETWNNSVPVMQHRFAANALDIGCEADLHRFAEVIQNDLIARAAAGLIRRRAW